MKQIKNIGLWLSAVLVVLCFAACSDDDDKADNSPITFKAVYLQDNKSSVPDRLVDFVRLGQTIRIEGSGFTGLRKIYVNGYETYFNPMYVTDTNVLLQLSAKTPITNADEADRNKIRFVKTGTSEEYTIAIRSAAPSISSIDITLPMPGETVTVTGSGLQEVTQVNLPGGVSVTTNIVSDEDGKFFTFVMPSGVTEGGAIHVIGANGEVRSANYFNYTSCMLLDFDGKGSQGAWSWSETGSMLGASDNTDDDGNITQRDERVDDPANSGRGKCMQMIPDRILNNADGGILPTKTRCTEVWTAGTGNADDDWTRMYSYIPAATPVTEVAFQFDVLVPDAWSGTGHIEIVLYNNFNFSGIGSDDDGNRTAFYVPYIQGGEMVPFQATRWQTVTIPFSEFGYYAKQIKEEEVVPTFQNVVEDRLAATYQNLGMGIVNNDFTYGGVSVTSSLFNQKIYVDNWRIVPYTVEATTDFPEDEE